MINGLIIASNVAIYFKVGQVVPAYMKFSSTYTVGNIQKDDTRGGFRIYDTNGIERHFVSKDVPYIIAENEPTT